MGFLLEVSTSIMYAAKLLSCKMLEVMSESGNPTRFLKLIFTVPGSSSVDSFQSCVLCVSNFSVFTKLKIAKQRYGSRVGLTRFLESEEHQLSFGESVYKVGGEPGSQHKVAGRTVQRVHFGGCA